MTHSGSKTPPSPTFDGSRPCRICSLPVTALSFGGPDVCPWCDCGVFRDGEQWSFRDATVEGAVRRKAQIKAGLVKDPRREGIFMRVMSNDGVHEGFIPFAPDTIGEEEGD
jgi:hypothetical protein